MTVLGVILLIASVFGFVRALQRTYAAAWRLPASGGPRNVGRGVVAATTLVGGLAGLTLLPPLVGILLDSAAFGLVVHAGTAILLWWPIQRILLNGRVGWRQLLPGALVTGVGEAALVISSSLYMPIAVSRATERFGLLGAAVVLLSWLVVLGLLLVVAAVLGAELTRPHRSPAADGVPVRPDVPPSSWRQEGAVVRYEFSVAGRLSETAAAAFPEMRRVSGPGGATRLFGEVHDLGDLDRILARIGDLGLDLVDIHQLPD